MKLYIGVNTEADIDGYYRTSCAYRDRDCVGESDGWTIVEIELPDVESEAHRVWREKREAALLSTNSSGHLRLSFLAGFDFAYPEPPFAEGGSQADAGVDHGN